MLVHVDPDISQLFGEVWPGASKIELTVFSGFWRNTKVRKGYSSRTWSWNGDIDGRHSKGAYRTIFSPLSIGILETNTG